MSIPSAELAKPFTSAEFELLRQFYAGVPTRVLRREFALDPWALLNRHRHLPPAQHQRLLHELRARPTSPEEIATTG